MLNLDKIKFALPPNLLEIASAKANVYREAQPFPHLVIDNFFPPEIAELAATTFPKQDSPEWERFYNVGLQSKAVAGIEKCSGVNLQLLLQLNDILMLKFLEQLTGIPGLMPDPYLYGRGLQQTRRGDFLEVHVDSNFHPFTKTYRRVNVLIYLTKDWREEYGGHLELWDKTMQYCVERVLPAFNRCLIFDIGETAFHGHPVPNSCPPEITRNLLSLVYCTAEPAETDSANPRGTLWQKRPDLEIVPTAVAESDMIIEDEKTNYLLNLRGKDLRNLIRENDSLQLRMAEAQQNLLAHINREKAALNQRVTTCEQEIPALEQKELELQAQHKRLLLELGQAQHWTRELEQKSNPGLRGQLRALWHKVRG